MHQLKTDCQLIDAELLEQIRAEAKSDRGDFYFLWIPGTFNTRTSTSHDTHCCCAYVPCLPKGLKKTLAAGDCLWAPLGTLSYQGTFPILCKAPHKDTAHT